MPKGERLGEGYASDTLRLKDQARLTPHLSSPLRKGRGTLVNVDIIPAAELLVGPRVKPEDRDVEPEPLGLRT